jgi:hypothetical protein
VLQAGSAISTRLRDDRNGYNVLHFDTEPITIAIREWGGDHWRSAQ